MLCTTWHVLPFSNSTRIQRQHVNLEKYRYRNEWCRMNLASFVTTWMEPEAEKLIADSINVNYVDAEQYPSSTEIQNRYMLRHTSQHSTTKLLTAHDANMPDLHCTTSSCAVIRMGH